MESLFVLTNDDGVDAPGMAALRRAVEGLGPAAVIAPRGAASGCGHQVTTHQPIAFSRRDDGAIAVFGTPADCVRLAVAGLAPRVRCVLSGINAGGNLGTDVYISGTVAAAREAAIRGLPAIAVSHYIARGRVIDWERAAAWAAPVIRDLLARPSAPGTYWNVNLPHPEPGGVFPGVCECPLDPSPLPLAYEFDGDTALYAGNYQARARIPGGDVDVCFGGRIAVSLLAVGPGGS
ncbi:5'-nucleotidase SurE [Aquisphaera giovannonii]|uniref:5'-nucleotidase n=1 Tax=Aquisphaera giovannonii TaxID=406548 RepID=A0A5B9W9Y0_9BACT|nr:5'/3'-nucleotidase SurE [Aquisphaera giovannonii]QEH36891.1 5'-nucleotidase SurE [Aquisphaera giovannonii]